MLLAWLTEEYDHAANWRKNAARMENFKIKLNLPRHIDSDQRLTSAYQTAFHRNRHDDCARSMRIRLISGLFNDDGSMSVA